MIDHSEKALCVAASATSIFEQLIILILCTCREKWTKRRYRIYCHPFPEVNGGIAQLVERLVRNESGRESLIKSQPLVTLFPVVKD